MEQLELPGWRLEFDRAATVAAHAKLLTGAPEACDCDHCRNWVRSRSVTFPPDYRTLLHRLGISLARESEVYHIGKLEPGLHLYAGWYHFVGRVLSGEKECSPNVTFEPFAVFFHSSPLLLHEVFADQPVVQLEFEARIPWLPDVPEPS